MSAPDPQRQHGSADLAELTRRHPQVSSWVDFSTSVNPSGPPSAIQASLATTCVRDYPHPDARPARDALAERLDLDPAQIVIGAGAADLLWLLARELGGRGRTAYISKPAFSEFEAAARHGGMRVREGRADSADGRAASVETIIDDLEAEPADILHLANPSSPGGQLLTLDELLRLSNSCVAGSIVLDESFLALSTSPGLATCELPDHVIRVRSLTKEFGLAGLRVGYLTTTARRARTLNAARPPWTVSSPAQAALVASVACDDWLAEQRASLLCASRQLQGDIRDLGYAVLASQTPYFVFAASRPDATRGRGAAELHRRLLRHGVIVRDCSSFGLPDHVRVATRTPTCNARLLRALREEIRTCPPAP